ncbi:hypothetical protein [Haloarcula argentinensis]|uniref:Transposase n=1 Tax=Haloarcula argentinensis TaxID=43776 RepID=A0ABU2F4B6_HALAR|nr:hypothetical protein [Haloarcula argentinensis]EMA26486.1 hypothetical protein C443_02032 [Haloarcula argentinensis DSM 12282]MDS0255327.1 hypothetical protein [Haloarcula argentinensis]
MSGPENRLPGCEQVFSYNAEAGRLIRKISHNDHRRHRHCPECGLVSFGGKLGDRPADVFRAVLDKILAACKHISQSRIRRLREGAMKRKREYGRSDTANVEEMLNDIRLGSERQN